MKKFRLYCETDSKYEYVISDSVPTDCPVDAGHTIRADSISVVDPDHRRLPDVSARQIREALLIQMSLAEADIDAQINTLPDPDKSIAMIQWKQSNMFERDRALVTTMGTMLGKTDAEMDALWLYAGTL